MNNIVNIKKISLGFFVLIGLIHFGSMILVSNQIWTKSLSLITSITDIPLIISGMLYGLASLRLTFTNPNEKYKKLDIFLFSLIILVLIVSVAINFIFEKL